MTNDLQKAIDEITNNSSSDATNGSDAAAELESKIKNQMGVPPVPPTVGDGVPPMPVPGAAPEVPTPEVAPAPAPAPEINQGIAPQPAPVAEAVAATETPIAAPEATSIVPDVQPASVETTMGGDLAKVKESALQELVPLMDKIDIPATEKFDIYREVIESTKDKSIVEKAFEAAKAIEDEKTKAESLLKLVQIIDTL